MKFLKECGCIYEESKSCFSKGVRLVKSCQRHREQASIEIEAKVTGSLSRALEGKSVEAFRSERVSYWVEEFHLDYEMATEMAETEIIEAIHKKLLKVV